MTEDEKKKFGINDKEDQKIKLVKNSNQKGFYDAGSTATTHQLLKALQKSIRQNDKGRISCILSYLLEHQLQPEQLVKYGKMKCQILIQIRAFTDAIQRAEQIFKKVGQQALQMLLIMAKAKMQKGQIWDGYLDFQLYKSYHSNCQDQHYFNSKMMHMKKTNLINPNYPQLRNIKIKQMVCGDHHVLALGVGFLDSFEQRRQVWGWGQNGVGQVNGFPSGAQVIKKPLIIKQLYNKNIAGLAACKQSSIAFDKQGNIYEWGDNQQVKQRYRIPGLQYISKGQKHYCAKSNQSLFLWGTIGNYKAPQPTKVNLKTTKQMNIISSFRNTFIWSPQQGQIYTIGDNLESHINQWSKIDALKYYCINKIFVCRYMVFFVTDQKEVYVWGMYNKEVYKANKPIQVSTQKDVISIAGSLYFNLSTSNGEMFIWEPQNYSKFKKVYQKEKVLSRSIVCPKGDNYYFTPVVEYARFIIPNQEYASYQSVQLQIKAYDLYGAYQINSPCGFHYHLYLSISMSSVQDLETVDKQSKRLYLENKNSDHYTCQEIISTYLVQVKVKDTKVCFTPIAHGNYFVYGFLNGVMIEGSGWQLVVGKSYQQESKKKQAMRQIQMREELNRKRKQQQEKRRRDKMRLEQEQRQKREQTQRRAQQALKKQFRMKEQQRKKQQQDKKRRSQLQTGGGFDLQKLKNKQQKNSQPIKNPPLPKANLRKTQQIKKK